MKPLTFFVGLIFAVEQGTLSLGDDNPGVEILFVLSARELPEGTLGSKPDSFVELTYFRSPDQAPDYFTNKTSTIHANYNPEWPDVFSIKFFEGHQQKIRFVVKHKKEEMGKVTVSLLDISKAQGGSLERNIIGSEPTDARLIISFILNGETNDDTDPRLLNSPKRIKVLKRMVETSDK